ncbi:MAG: hypothetical protein KatS3mg002_1351 [Candidatus Woesearchaeota archaeon]|nr:MAG: hypothetical protein KatS3mg002_1351 [Candidatus Woesearchaeota archaeon]
MATKIKDVVNRLRYLLKANNVDALVTDRFLWSVFNSSTDLILQKYNDVYNIVSSPEMYTTIKGIDVVEENMLALSCFDGFECCNDYPIFRTEKKIPEVRSLNGKVLIRNVTSIDYSHYFTHIDIYDIPNIVNSRFKRFIKNKYFSYMDGYVWLIDMSVYGDKEINKGKGIPRKINITASFKDVVNAKAFSCDCEDDSKECIVAQDMQINIPDTIIADVENMAIQKLITMLNIQTTFDTKDNKHINRSE